MRKIKLYITAAIMGLTLSGPILVPTVAYASASCPAATTSKGQVLSGLGATGNHCDASSFKNTVANAVGILSVIAGIVAVIMIIISGFRYITSGGESSRVAAAKNSLIYALIGIAVVALTQFLVRYVVNTSIHGT
jgi:hypothetical protein